jgi:hypothetical protein
VAKYSGEESGLELSGVHEEKRHKGKHKGKHKGFMKGMGKGRKRS